MFRPLRVAGPGGEGNMHCLDVEQVLHLPLWTSEMFGLLKQPWLIQPGPVETLVDSTINQESTRKWLKYPVFQQVVEITRNQLGIWMSS